MSAPPEDLAALPLRRRIEAQHRTLSAVLDALAQGGGGFSVTIGPSAPRPAPSPPPQAVPDIPGWPGPALPSQPLRPPPGWACASLAAGQHPVIAVALFGLDAAAVASGVAQIDLRQRQAMNFVPVFLTDHADATPFRRTGHVVEYFPSAIYGDAAVPGPFREKYALARHKWGVASLIDLSAPGWLEARVPPVPAAPPAVEAEERTSPAMGPVPPLDIAAAKAETAARGLDRVADDFILYRIIGNDLYPRHRRGQAADNLRFILEREPPLPNCTKAWVVNRIGDPEQEAAIVALLEGHGQAYLHIPFEWDAYAAIHPDLTAFAASALFTRVDRSAMGPRRRMRAEVQARRPKVLYAMNNNGSRNAALADGRGRAKWVLPWDGNCFLTAAAWQEITDAVRARPYLKYFVVPMARLLDNESVADPDFRPDPVEEPQILFRRDAEEAFDERFPYGRRSKVELLWRLGVPGPWERWFDDPWDLPRPARAADAGQVGRAGWVARLFSGMAELELPDRAAIAGRESARNEAILATIDHLDQAALRRRLDPQELTAYDEGALSALASGGPAPWRDALRRAAAEALGRAPYSILDKTTLPPSGDPRDYWHPAPYWWPDPAKPDGLPYIRRDGHRVPGTELYEPGSEQFDRTRLQRLFDDTTILALAWRVEGDPGCARHAADLVRRWFVEPATRMNPHLRYAQVRLGHGDGEGHNFGVIEAKDLYFFLDAVRLLERAGTLTPDDVSAVREWLSTYLDWLRTGRQGVAESRTRNNHGTCYDLQVAAVAAYLGDVPTLLSTFFLTRERLIAQFDAEGAQPEELSRTQTAHYCCFNLQSWLNLATLAETCGVSLWAYPAQDGSVLRRALVWLDGLASLERWPHRQSEPFVRDRLLPLRRAGHVRFGLADAAGDPAGWRPLFDPHDGIKPFWMLGRDVGGAKFPQFLR